MIFDQPQWFCTKLKSDIFHLFTPTDALRNWLMLHVHGGEFWKRKNTFIKMFSIVCRLLCDPVARMEAIKGTLTRIQRLVMRIAKSASQSSTILTIAARRWRHPIYCEVMRLPSGRVGALSRALWWEGEPSSSSSANMGLGIGNESPPAPPCPPFGRRKAKAGPHFSFL